MNTTLHDLVVRKAQLEQETAQLERDYEAAYSRWIMANTELIQRRNEAKKALEEVNGEIDAAALEIYERTQNKTPHEAVTIRLAPRLQVDQEAAIDWALELGRGDLLSINKSAFNEAVKNGEVPEEVARVVKVPQASKQKRLGEYLLLADLPEESIYDE